MIGRDESGCECEPSALYAVGVQWLDHTVLGGGWWNRHGSELGETTYVPSYRCRRCNHVISKRPRPDAWLESDEFKRLDAEQRLDAS